MRRVKMDTPALSGWRALPSAFMLPSLFPEQRERRRPS